MTTRFSRRAAGLLALMVGVWGVGGSSLSGAPPTGDAGFLGGAAGDTVRGDVDLAAAIAARLDSLDAPRLDSLYGEEPEPLWLDGEGGLTPRGRAAWAELEGADQRGLPAGRYDMARLSGLRSEEGPSLEARAALETGVSRGLLLLVHDVAGGVLPAEGVDTGWRLDSLDAARLPGPDSATASPAALLDELDRVTPEVRQYDRLLPLLQRLRALRDSGGWSELPPLDGVVAVGDSAALVADLRRRLRQSLSPVERRLARRGGFDLRYDSALARSVEHFQQRHGIAVDGILGPATHRELNTPVETRIAAVRVALERWRWLPASPGAADLEGEPAILVNTAGRHMHVMENGVPVIAMKVIVGQRDWKTTLFQDAMERLVINPYWNVPRTILEEETLPKAAEDPEYLERNDFQVLDSEGEVVPLEAVDWQDVDPAAFPHRIRQLPGDGNALGRVKFLFPNRFAIYLHDTPADQLFDERVRTFSHGCIRVERPTEFAHYLLRTASDVPPARFGELRASQERHVVELAEHIPTYVVYQTVWVDADGLPTFTPDIYQRDGPVRDALAALDRRATETP